MRSSFVGMVDSQMRILTQGDQFKTGSEIWFKRACVFQGSWNVHRSLL
jgi:hypothetical protein